MGNTYVKNGTPVGNLHLCKGCTHGQVTTGYRESDILVVCTNPYPNIRVPFVVHECSDFEDKLKPNWQQMKQLAIHIEPTRVSKKTRGFHATQVPVPAPLDVEHEEEEDETEDEQVAAIAR